MGGGGARGGGLHPVPPNAPWLPPNEEDLEEVATNYRMLENDPVAGERGLIGHVAYRRDPEAREVLDAWYAERSLNPPRSY